MRSSDDAPEPASAPAGAAVAPTLSCRRGRLRSARLDGAEGGGVDLNPFTTPDRLYISRRPQDMRAGIQRLASVVTTDFSMDPTDGALYCFASRDCLKMKLLRGPRRSRCGRAAIPARGGAWRSRWRSGGRGPGGRGPSRRRPRARPWRASR